MNFNQTELDTIARAMAILEERARYDAVALTSPSAVSEYIRLRVGALEHEVFGVLWLDAQNCLIEAEDLFRGTLTQTSVYPREVVKAALAKNAAAAILYHNHPSGNPEPSRADEALTNNLKNALALVDVRVLDHIVVTAGKSSSFAERGLI
jgi:DNA repair protein RadC